VLTYLLTYFFMCHFILG